MQHNNGFRYSLQEQYNAMKLEMNGQRYVIVVEGKIDRNFYSHHFNFKNSDVFFYSPIHAKDSKLCVIKLVTQNNLLTNIIGIIDSDFDFIEKKTVKHPKIFYTDYHDLETFIIVSNVLQKILNLRSVTNDKLIQICSEINTNNSLGDIFRQIVYKKALLLGKLRLLNLRNNWNLSFKKYLRGKWDSSFISSVNSENLHECVQILFSDIDSNSPPVTISEVKNAYNNLVLDSSFNYPHICHGKDMFKIIEFYMNTYLSDRSKKQFTRENLIDAYESDYFRETQLYTDICNFIRNN